MSALDTVRRSTRLRVTAGAAVALLAMLAPGSATAQQSPSSARAAISATTHAKARPTFVAVHVSLPNCDVCRMRMQNLLDTRPFSFWQSKWKRAHNGHLTFKVTAPHTRGSVFRIKAPWADPLDYVPLVAMHYRGFVAGDPVSGSESAAAKQATVCWVGAQRETTLVVRTARFATEWPPGSAATGIRAWTAHTKLKLGRYRPTDHGAAGTQDYVPCPRR